MGQGRPKTQLGHEVGSSGAAVEVTGGLGRVCCSRLAEEPEPAQAEGVQLVNAIYTMYKLVNQSLGWQRPHQVQAPRQREGHRGEGRARPTPSWHSRGKREEVPMAPPDTKTVERIL